MSTHLEEDRARTSLTCPRCQAGHLDPARSVDGFVACSECGHRAAAPYVAEELWLERQEGQLRARLAWVRDRVVAGDAPVESLGRSAQPVPPPGHPPVKIQTVLLSGGALLLVLAAVVFAAVAWNRLGAGGQIAVLVAVVAALSAAAHALRASYRSTAEALAAIAAGVAAVALLAAPRLGLGPDWTRDLPATWATLAFAILAALAAAMAWASRLVAWHVALAAALVAMAFSAALAAGGGSSIAPLGCAGLAAAAAAILRLHPGRIGPYSHEAPWIGAGIGGLALIAGLAGYQHLDQAAAWAGAWFVVGVCAAALVVPLRVAVPVAWTVGLASGVVAGLALGQVPPLLAAGSTLDRWVTVPLLALCGTAFLVGTLAPRLAAPCLVATVTLWTASLPVLAATGDVTAPQASAYLGIIAISLLAMSFVPGRTPIVWVAAVVGTASLWVLLADRGVTVLEVFTGGCAALLLVAGLVQHRAQPSLGSLVVVGPALSMAALPSAILAFAQAPTSDDALRAGLVILGGAVLAVLGARLRVKAALFVGLAAAIVAGLGQVVALVDLVPRWLALAAAGVLLVAAGFSAERLGRAGRHAWRATQRMR